MLVHVALGDGVGDTLVTQDISEPVEERWRVVVSNRGARAVRSASRAEIREREKRGANPASSLTFRMSWSITLHVARWWCAHAHTLPAVGRGSSMRSKFVACVQTALNVRAYGQRLLRLQHEATMASSGTKCATEHHESESWTPRLRPPSRRRDPAPTELPRKKMIGETRSVTNTPSAAVASNARQGARELRPYPASVCHLFVGETVGASGFG